MSRDFNGDSCVERCRASCIYTQISYILLGQINLCQSCIHARYLQLAYLSPILLCACLKRAERFPAAVTLYFTIASSTRTPESLSRDDELVPLTSSSQPAAIINNKISKPPHISLIIHGTILTRAQSQIIPIVLKLTTRLLEFCKFASQLNTFECRYQNFDSTCVLMRVFLYFVNCNRRKFLFYFLKFCERDIDV